jgi:hypothetical protein
MGKRLTFTVREELEKNAEVIDSFGDTKDEVLNEALYNVMGGLSLSLKDAIYNADICLANDIYEKNPGPNGKSMEDLVADHELAGNLSNQFSWSIMFDKQKACFEAFFGHTENDWLCPKLIFQFYIKSPKSEEQSE